jgi:hypothetical protein
MLKWPIVSRNKSTAENSDPQVIHVPVAWQVMLTFAPVLAAFVPWLFAQMNTSLNTNHAWLTICAERLLDGGRQLTDFYEPNPPLSILLYVPGVLLSRLTGIPVYYMPYLTGLAALGLSTLAVYFLLRKWPLVEGQALTVFIGAYLLAGTVLASRMFFAERDEFTVWGLMPFLIAQLAITRGAALPRRLTWAVLIPGAACILIKPHYVLLPAALILHRMITQRKFFPVQRDADFIALAGASAIYALLVALFFRDYVSFILPDFLKLYIPVHRRAVTLKKTLRGAGLLAALLAGAAFPLTEDIKRAVRQCAAAAALCGVLFMLQGKGNYYQEIPFMVFIFCGAALLLYEIGCRAGRSPFCSAFVTLSLLAVFACAETPVRSGFPTHEDYKKLKLTQLAAQVPRGGSFFVFSEGMEMIHQASIYGGAVHASRFPDLWWLDGLTRGWGSAGKSARYAGYVAEDIERYKPQVMAIDGAYFGLISWLDRYSPSFRAEMTHYRKDGQLVDNRRDYFRGTALDYDHVIVYDIYRRIP